MSRWCRTPRRRVPDASVDAVVTDPPYELGFMGKGWDATGIAYNVDLWRDVMRVLKPGGHMLAFGGTRTWHRLACAIEDAGFEVRDSIAWLYGSGFPKSLDVSKAIDRANGAERQVVATERSPFRMADPKTGDTYMSTVNGDSRSTDADGYIVRNVTAPSTDDARTWQGWGTALKPAFEPVVVARKPLTGTVAANVLAHGTGALNIDACRIEGAKPDTTRGASVKASSMAAPLGAQGRIVDDGAGRWPANVVLDESQAAELDRQSGVLTSGNRKAGDYGLMGYMGADVAAMPDVIGDTGGASRFFYVAKAPTAERPRVKREGAGEGRVIEGTTKVCRVCGSKTIKPPNPSPACGHNDYERVPTAKREEHVAHPTVKPLDLMRWLVRLVTPPGGVVLEPFAGSGTTAEACVIEGFRCIAIEREADYLPLIVQRLTKPIQPDLFGSLGGDVA